MIKVPFILGGIVAAAIYCGKKLYDNPPRGKRLYDNSPQDEKSLTDIINKHIKEWEDFKKSSQDISAALSELGALELKIGADFQHFMKLTSELKEKSAVENSAEIKINVSAETLTKITHFAISATQYAKSEEKGKEVPFALLNGIVNLSASVSETAVERLSTVDFYKDFLSQRVKNIGSPMKSELFTAGILSNGLGFKLAALDFCCALYKGPYNFRTYMIEQIKSKDYNKINLLKEYFYEQSKEIKVFTRELKELYIEFNNSVEKLKDCISDEGKLNSGVEYCYQLASTLTDMLTTPLLKLKKDENNNVLMSSSDLREADRFIKLPEFVSNEDNFLLFNWEEVRRRKLVKLN